MIDIYLKMLFSLLVVLAMLGCAYLLLKRNLYMQKKESLFEVLDYKPFGPKTGVMALKCGSKIFLLAVSPTVINVIERVGINELGTEDVSEEEIFEKIKKLKEGMDELN